MKLSGRSYLSYWSDGCSINEPDGNGATVNTCTATNAFRRGSLWIHVDGWNIHSGVNDSSGNNRLHRFCTAAAVNPPDQPWQQHPAWTLVERRGGQYSGLIARSVLL